MAKVKKKRNKKYSGADAADNRPKVTRVQAANRNALQQWGHERKQQIKTGATISAIIAVIILIILGIASLF